MNTLINLFAALITLIIKTSFIIENFSIRLKQLLRMPTLV